MHRNKRALQALNSVSENIRTSLLDSLSQDLVLALIEIARNIIIGNVPISETQFNQLRRNKKDLHELIRKNTSFKKQKKILQKGNGLMGDIIDPVLSLF
jgi:hypothetical protein